MTTTDHPPIHPPANEAIPEAEEGAEEVKSVAVKVAIVGDPGIGKTSLMLKYVRGDFEPQYVQTLGVSCMEKSIFIHDVKITFSIWDLGGQKEFNSMLPVCALDSTAILYFFDLVKPSSIKSAIEWYRQAKSYAQESIPIVVGTKFDEFLLQSPEYQAAVTDKARRLAAAMSAPLVFCSSASAINIKVIFKIIIIKAFGLQSTITERRLVGEPIVEYK